MAFTSLWRSRPHAAASSEKGADDPDGRSFLNVALWLTGFKLVYSLLFICTVNLMPPDLFNIQWFLADYHHTALPLPSYGKYFETWDTQYYITIAEQGYTQDARQAAFYPLWPLCIRLFSVFTFGNYLDSGVVLSNAFSVLGLTVLFRYIQTAYGRMIAERSTILLLAVPGALFYFLPYTESLFLLLTALVFRFMQKQKFVVPGIATFLAALCRPSGLFLVPFYLLDFFRSRNKIMLLLGASGVAGYALYLGIMAKLTGNAFTQMAVANKFISNNSVDNFFDLSGFISAFVTMSASHDIVHSCFDRLLFVWCLAMLPSLYKLDKTLFFYCLAMGVLPALAGHFTSYLRYSAVDFPILLMTAILLSKDRFQPGFVLLAGGLYGLQLLMLIRQINFNWAG